MTWILRKLPIVAALLGFAVAFVWLDQDRQFRKEHYPPFSLHNTSGEGCSLAFRYLRARHQRADAASTGELNRMIDLSALEPNAVVFRVGPQLVPGELVEAPQTKGITPTPPKVRAADPKKPLLTPGEKTWVEGGGRLVLALEDVYGPVESRPLIAVGDVRKVFPIWPAIQTLEAARARMLAGEPLNAAQTLFAIGSDVYAARLPVGKGDVMLFAGADIFSNRHLAADSHLELLTAQLDDNRPFYFDEYVHHLQSAPGIFELLNRWGFGVALLAIGALALGAFWRARTPLGPPEDNFRETRSQAVDFVGSLAPLYERSLSPEQALAMHYKNFLQAAAAQSGLRGDALAAKIRALLAEAAQGRPADEEALTGRKPLDRAQFSRHLKVLNEAYRRLELAHRH